MTPPPPHALPSRPPGPLPHDCEKAAPDGFLLSGHRQDGELYTCPVCLKVWVHLCDEATGCAWLLGTERTEQMVKDHRQGLAERGLL